MSPAYYAHLTSRGHYALAPHLAVLSDRLHALAERRIRRLIIEKPPRHGKSELTSAKFPAWYLGHFPEHRVILGSYEAAFARSWGRRCRDTFNEYSPALFGLRVSSVQSAQDWWDVDGHRGGMQTAGAGGAFTGKGADLAIIDDPIKDASEARSEVIRANLWDWWKSTFYTRLEPDAVAVVIMTRWHTDDLVGRLVREEQEGEGEHWERVTMPALATDDEAWYSVNEPEELLWTRAAGEPLWTKRFDLDAIQAIRRTQTAYWWSSLYQQNPRSETGRNFDRSWFEPLDTAPRGWRWVRYFDLASTAKTATNRPDWTVAVLMGTDGRRYCVADVTRFQAGPAETERRIGEIRKTDRMRFGAGVRFYIELEPGATAKLYHAYLARTVFKGTAFRSDPVSGGASKLDRADPFSAAAENRLCLYVKGKWNGPYFDELEAFPVGAHDDQVDSSAGAYNRLSVRRTYAPATGAIPQTAVSGR